MTPLLTEANIYLRRDSYARRAIRGANEMSASLVLTIESEARDKALTVRSDAETTRTPLRGTRASAHH